MGNKRFKPLIDKLFWWIAIPTAILFLFLILISVCALVAFLITFSAMLLTAYFLISPLFGYVELREKTVFIKFGFFMKREIPYEKIRGTKKERKWYSDSMLSLKNSIEHVNIQYNTFDFVTISVVDNDEFIRELNKRRFCE